MSAFYCSDETFSAVAFLIRERPAPLHHPLPTDADALVRTLARMNAEAILQRYGDDNFADADAVTYIDPPEAVKRNRPALFKSLGCYTYQCAEGNVPDTALFKALDQFETLLKPLYGPDNPATAAAYEAAPWVSTSGAMSHDPVT